MCAQPCCQEPWWLASGKEEGIKGYRTHLVEFAVGKENWKAATGINVVQLYDILVLVLLGEMSKNVVSKSIGI